MCIDITETEYKSIKFATLQFYAKNRISITKIYIAKFGEKEVGIITLDCYSPPNPLFVYFIFVENSYRKRGIGTMLLDHAERIAIERGNPSIVLEPREVEQNISLQKLTYWYNRKGYSQRVGDPLRLEKLLDIGKQSCSKERSLTQHQPDSGSAPFGWATTRPREPGAFCQKCAIIEEGSRQSRGCR